MNGYEVNSEEFKILHQMDMAFCSEMNKELKAFRERQMEESKRPK